MKSSERKNQASDLLERLKQQEWALIHERPLTDLNLSEHRLLLSNLEKQASLIRLQQAEDRLNTWLTRSIITAAGAFAVYTISKFFNFM